MDESELCKVRVPLSAKNKIKSMSHSDDDAAQKPYDAVRIGERRRHLWCPHGHRAAPLECHIVEVVFNSI